MHSHVRRVEHSLVLKCTLRCVFPATLAYWFFSNFIISFEDDCMPKARGTIVTTIGRCCPRCQKLSSNKSQPYLQTMFPHIRYRRNIESRRKNNRPETLGVLGSVGNMSLSDDPPDRRSSNWKKVELHYDQHPSFLLLPVFNPPGIFVAGHERTAATKPKSECRATFSLIFAR